MVKTEDIEQVLDSDMIEKQWKYYTSTGDSHTISTKAEDVWEYHERRTGEALEKPIITVDETRGKTDDELKKLATGHRMNLEGLNPLQKRTAFFLYVTGQKKMAYRMIVNCNIKIKKKPLHLESKKVFTREDYNEHDKPSKVEAKLFWESNGHKVDLDEKDSFTFDLKVEKENQWLEVEVEHKTVWKEKEWPINFDTVDVPYRKHANTSDIYMLFNNNYDGMCITEMDNIHNAPTSRKDTTYTEGEIFFNVPLDKFTFFKKDDGKWGTEK